MRSTRVPQAGLRLIVSLGCSLLFVIVSTATARYIPLIGTPQEFSSRPRERDDDNHLPTATTTTSVAIREEAGSTNDAEEEENSATQLEMTSESTSGAITSNSSSSSVESPSSSSTNETRNLDRNNNGISGGIGGSRSEFQVSSNLPSPSPAENNGMSSGSHADVVMSGSLYDYNFDLSKSPRITEPDDDGLLTTERRKDKRALSSSSLQRTSRRNDVSTRREKSGRTTKNPVETAPAPSIDSVFMDLESEEVRTPHLPTARTSGRGSTGSQKNSSQVIFLTLQGDGESEEPRKLGGKRGNSRFSSEELVGKITGNRHDDATTKRSNSRGIPVKSGTTTGKSVGTSPATGGTLVFVDLESGEVHETPTTRGSSGRGGVGRSGTLSETTSHIFLTLQGDDEVDESDTLMHYKTTPATPTPGGNLKGTAKNYGTPTLIYLTLEGDTDIPESDINTPNNTTESPGSPPPEPDVPSPAENTTKNATVDEESPKEEEKPRKLSSRVDDMNEYEKEEEVVTTTTTTTEEIPVLQTYDSELFHGNDKFEIQDDFDVWVERGCTDFSCKDDA